MQFETIDFAVAFATVSEFSTLFLYLVIWKAYVFTPTYNLYKFAVWYTSATPKLFNPIWENRQEHEAQRQRIAGYGMPFAGAIMKKNTVRSVTIH